MFLQNHVYPNDRRLAGGAKAPGKILQRVIPPTAIHPSVIHLKRTFLWWLTDEAHRTETELRWPYDKDTPVSVSEGDVVPAPHSKRMPVK